MHQYLYQARFWLYNLERNMNLKQRDVEWFVLVGAIGLLLLITPILGGYSLLLLPIIALSIWNYHGQKKHLDALTKLRQGENFEDFMRLLNENCCNEELVKSIYHQSQLLFDANHRHFPLRPDDHYFSDLNIGEDAVSCDLITSIASVNHITLKNWQNNPLNNKVETPRDLIHWFEQQLQANHYQKL